MVLTLEDLPSGFEAMPPAEFGFTKEDLSQDDFTVESLFAFLEAEHFELVMGFTTLVPTKLEQAGFDVALRQPDFLLDSVIGGMGTTDILEQNDLPDFDDICDASAGVTVAVDMEGIPMRMDIVAFRRDVVGAFVFVMYIDGDVPIVPIGDVTRKFDERIVEVLSVTPTLVLPTSTPAPMPSATGVVRGVLIDKSTGQPVVDERVALATVTEFDEDKNSFSMAVTWDEQGEIMYSAYTDATGAFVVEAPPGTYVLVSPGGSLNDRIARIDDTTVLFINIEAGQIIDVGEVQMLP